MRDHFGMIEILEYGIDFPILFTPIHLGMG